MEAQRAMLDALLGKDRDRTRDDGPMREEKWTDEDVCPYFLCGFCPHDLFTNTKSDLGPCPCKHSQRLASEFQKEEPRTRRRVEKEFLQYLRELTRECDKKIRRGKDRIALNAPSTTPNPAVVQQIEKKKHDIGVRKEQLVSEISTIKEQMERLGDMGRIDDVEAMLTQLEPLEEQMKELEKLEAELSGEDAYLHVQPQARNDKHRFEVCDICGVFQAIDDAEERRARHFEGKQHLGMLAIRNKIEELENNFQQNQNGDSRDNRRYDDRHSSEARRGDRDRNRDRDRDRDRNRRDRDRDRERDRGHRSRHERERRHRDRSRSRSRSSRDKHRRSKHSHSRSNDRDRDRDRDGRSRDHDKRRKRSKHSDRD